MRLYNSKSLVGVFKFRSRNLGLVVHIEATFAREPTPCFPPMALLAQPIMVFRECDRTNMSGRCAVATMSVGKTNPPKSDCTAQSVLGASQLLAAIFRLGYTFAPALTNSIIRFGITPETPSHASSHSSSATLSSTATTWLWFILIWMVCALD